MFHGYYLFCHLINSTDSGRGLWGSADLHLPGRGRRAVWWFLWWDRMRFHSQLNLHSLGANSHPWSHTRPHRAKAVCLNMEVGTRDQDFCTKATNTTLLNTRLNTPYFCSIKENRNKKIKGYTKVEPCKQLKKKQLRVLTNRRTASNALFRFQPQPLPSRFSKCWSLQMGRL